MVLTFQPKQIMEIKDFLLTARRKDAKCKLHIKRNILFRYLVEIIVFSHL